MLGTRLANLVMLGTQLASDTISWIKLIDRLLLEIGTKFAFFVIFMTKLDVIDIFIN